VISSISFVSAESILKYINESENNDLRRRRMFLLDEFDNQKIAFDERIDYEGNAFKKLGDSYYHVSEKNVEEIFMGAV